MVDGLQRVFVGFENNCWVSRDMYGFSELEAGRLSNL